VGSVWWVDTGYKKSGQRKKILCPKSGNRPCQAHIRRTITQCNGCPYGLVVEERDGKWYSKRFISLVHNHELFKEDHAGELRVIPAERTIPNEVFDYGQSLLRSGMRMRDVNVSLQQMMKDKGETPMWTYKDVCNKLAPSLGEKARDCSDFLNLLRNRHDSKSWNIHCDNEGRLPRAFFTLEEGKEAWIKASSSRVLLYDTSHATNTMG